MYWNDSMCLDQAVNAAHTIKQIKEKVREIRIRNNVYRYFM